MHVRRPELVIAAAIAVSLPMIPSFLDGAISVAAALVRFAVALALCWAASALVERVYGAYSRQARSTEIQQAIEEARRRAGQSPQGPDER